MATRLRKTRNLRGSRTHGWGQVAQHRASGHKGGLGVSGMLKHHYSTMLRDDPDHFGHDSTHPPHSNDARTWASVRDLDDLYAHHGHQDGDKKIIDLSSGGYDKLLGGGSVTSAYTVIVDAATKPAAQKVRNAGGELIVSAKTVAKSDTDSAEDKAVSDNG